jgi:hypothetical protein
MIDAYDEADGNRSELMRDALREHIEDGRLDELPERYELLAARESAVAEGRLERERGKFRHNVREFFASRWREGSTPDEAEDMAESYRAEAELYGDEYEQFVEAVVSFYVDEWKVTGRPDFPTTDEFTMMARGADVPDEAREYAERVAEAGALRYEQTVDEVRKRYPLPVARAAAKEVHDADEV